MIEFLILASIGLPLLGAFFSFVLREKARESWAIGTTALAFIFSCALIPQLIARQSIWIQPFNFGSPLFNLSFELDKISLVFALLFSFVGLVTLIYSINYIKKNKSEYYFTTSLLIGSLMGVAYANNLILLYVFWELAAFTTWRLVGFSRKAELIRLADKTFLMTFVGSSLMLIGFILIYLQKGTLDLDLLRGETFKYGIQIFNLIFLGMIAKSAFLPIYTWPSDAYPAAPSPAAALLSGIVSKIGLLAFAKIFVTTFNLSFNWILYLAAVSAIVAGGSALVANDVKKIVAYSSISQIAYILLGFGILTKLGIQAALLYAIVHGLGAAGLFLGVGIVELHTGERDIRKLGGFMKVSPVTGVGFLFCVLSIAGLPPFGGFWAKLTVIMGLVKANYTFVAVLAIFAAMLTLFYLFRLFNGVFLPAKHLPAGKAGTAGKPARDKSLSGDNPKISKTMVGCVLTLGIASLLLGIFISSFWAFIQ